MPSRAKTSLTSALVGLLRSDAVEKQIAAAIVVGELGVRDAAAVQGLLALVQSGLGPLQRHGLEALARVQPRAALTAALPLLGARDEGVRNAALGTVVAAGETAVPAVRARLQSADGEERRALEAALARLGGRDAFSALLESLEGDAGNPEAARAATLAVRQRIKEAGGRERQGYLGQVVKHLESKKTRASADATAATIKILGFLEDPGSVKRLLAFATKASNADVVREEAVIALRFAFKSGTLTGFPNPPATDSARAKPELRPRGHGKAPAGLAAALLAIAERAPVAVARAALYTLMGFDLPPALTARLGKLATHPDADRARLAIDRLAQTATPAAADALGKILLGTAERARAEAAGAALSARADAGPALARALLAAPDADRAWMLVKMLRPHVRKLETRQCKPIVDEALDRIRAGKAPWEPFLQVAREANAAATSAGLRALAGELRKAKKLDRALIAARALGGSAEATPDDGYALAILELLTGRRDEAFVVFRQLADRGFDVAAALRRDRALDADQRYQIGFHFAEQRHPLGEEILTAVAETAGRAKIGQMARAKLRTAGREA